MSEYHSYLLRVWIEDDDLRIMLESADSNERRGFPTLAAMVDFLDQQCCSESEPILMTTIPPAEYKTSPE